MPAPPCAEAPGERRRRRHVVTGSRRCARRCGAVGCGAEARGGASRPGEELSNKATGGAADADADEQRSPPRRHKMPRHERAPLGAHSRSSSSESDGAQWMMAPSRPSPSPRSDLENAPPPRPTQHWPRWSYDWDAPALGNRQARRCQQTASRTTTPRLTQRADAARTRPPGARAFCCWSATGSTTRPARTTSCASSRRWAARKPPPPGIGCARAWRRWAASRRASSCTAP